MFHSKIKSTISCPHHFFFFLVLAISRIITSYIQVFINPGQLLVPSNLFFHLAALPHHSFFTTSSRLILGLPVGLFPVFGSSLILRSNGFWFLQVYLVHRSLLFPIGSTMFDFWYNDSNSSFFLTLRSLVTLCFTGPKTLLSIFLSKTRSLVSSGFRIGQVSAPHVTTGLIKVVYTCFFKSLDRVRDPNNFAGPEKRLFPD